MGDHRPTSGHNASATLLGPHDPDPVAIERPGGGSPILLTGDHAGRLIPAALGTMGLAPADRERHIAWDIGVAALGLALSARLDATFVHQRYSRLVIDCNRNPEADDATPAASDRTAIRCNAASTAAERARRIAEIHAPYQRAIAAAIARRAAAGQETVLVALHSFTPEMDGDRRPWDIGILHAGHRDSYALALLARLRADAALVVGDNAPYRMDATDHSVPRHAFAGGLRYAEIEVAQARLQTDADIYGWAERHAPALADALREVW